MNTRKSQFPLCRHTMTNGRLCQSPACGDSRFCYFHKKLHPTRRKSIVAMRPYSSMEFLVVTGLLCRHIPQLTHSNHCVGESRSRTWP
jgi:hypothetical protein